jgi:NADH-quinone oxidoreductase subunit J
MRAAFYLAGAVAVASTVMMLTRLNVVHALLYLVLSLLAVAVAFFALGAPFVGALEIIVYAGAIMVLFVFVMMMLNLGDEATENERRWLTPGIWQLPAVLGVLLLAEAIYLFTREGGGEPVQAVGPKDVALSLFGPYALGVELASMLLLAGLVGAYHLGWQRRARGAEEEVRDAVDTDGARVAPGRDAVRAGTRRPPRAA